MKKKSQWNHSKYKGYFKGSYKTLSERVDSDTGYVIYERVFTLSGMIGNKPRIFSFESPYQAKTQGWVKVK